MPRLATRLTGAVPPRSEHRPLPPERRLPLVDRLDPDAPGYLGIVAAHEAAMTADEDGYLDPATGFFVFTAGSHWARGTCCRTGCRHCPYEPGRRATWDEVRARVAGSGGRDGQPRPGTE